MIKLSPNESALIQRQLELEQRRNRLIKVRQLERQRQSERRLKFQQQVQSNLSQVQQELQSDWKENRRRELSELEQRFQLAMKRFGESFSAADVVQKEHDSHNVAMKQELTGQWVKEDERFLQALHNFRQEEFEEDRPHKEALERLEHIRSQESQRAHHLAQQYRLHHPADELPAHSALPASLPLHKQRLLQQQLSAVNDGFEDTYHHRRTYTSSSSDYAAISVRQPTSIKKQGGAREAALKASMDARERMRREEELNEERERASRMRFVHAWHDVQMDKEKDVLVHELDEWQLADRRRKQSLKELEEHTFKNEVRMPPSRKTEYLSKFFESQFADVKRPNVIMTTVRHGSLRGEGLYSTSSDQNGVSTTSSPTRVIHDLEPRK